MTTPISDLPLWIVAPTVLLVLSGSGLAAIGCLGLLRLPSFYQRAHATTLGTTLGIGCILVGSMVFFSALETRVVVHEILIAAVMIVTTPISLTLLVRASLFRDRSERNDSVPPAR
jgi:multicomponent K+:H+ antiporter subunit G